MNPSVAACVPEVNMETQEPIEVYTVTNPALAEMIRNALREAGILCEISGEGQGGFSGVFEIQILTRAVDADRARHICTALEQHHGKSATGEEDF
jgi:hypothetical protein